MDSLFLSQSIVCCDDEDTESFTTVDITGCDDKHLTATNLDKHTVMLLGTHQIYTVAEAREYLTEHNTFEGLPGIGKKTSAKILETLGVENNA